MVSTSRTHTPPTPCPKGGRKRKHRKNSSPTTEPASPPKRVKTETLGNSTESGGGRAKKDVTNTVFDDIVFLKVGPTATKFGIHRGLLMKSSAYFKTILEPGYKAESKDLILAREGESTIIILPDENAGVFARISTWLYSHRFRAPEEPWPSITWQHIINVYTFAVDKGMTMLHNACIDATILKVKDGGLFPGQDTINQLWKTGKHTIPLRRLFIKLFAIHCELKTAILSNGHYNQTFLNWLVIELYEMQQKGMKPGAVNLYAHKKDYYVYGSDNPIPVD